METVSSPPVPSGSPPSAEEALDQLLRQIIEGFFVLTDGQGALSKWSEPAELLFGLEAEDALMEPFFGKLVPTGALSPQADSWRSFLETGDVPGATGRVRVDALKPGGGTFALETVFIPVKLDEGFDFSLFLEDLGFELPMDMMLLRMRQQHPVVVRALRSALEPAAQPWDGVRTAGTLVAFRPLELTPWMDEAMARREAEAAEAEVEMQSRIQALEAPAVQGTDVYDLDDARAVIDRLRWATERIEELEERSRIADVAVQDAADARVRAEAAERAALDVRAEMSGVLAERPADPTDEAGRLELLARIERVERAAAGAVEAASVQRAAAEAERARSAELEAQRAELLARLEAVERSAGSPSVAEAAIADARAELSARLEAIERAERGRPAGTDLAARLEALERAQAQEREELARLRASGDVREDLETLSGQVAALDRLREELETLRERADMQSGIIRRSASREAAAVQDAESAREELAAGLRRIEDLSEETARLRAILDSAPDQVGLSPEERHKLEAAAAGVAETRADIEAVRHLAEELRTQSAQLRDDESRLQAKLSELAGVAEENRHSRESLAREQAEIARSVEELRADRDQARDQLREALRAAEEARALAERGPAEGDGPPPATTDEVMAARARLDELSGALERMESRLEEARSDAAGARAEIEELRTSTSDAHRVARDATEQAELADRGNQSALAQISTQAAILEEIGALARSAQIDAGESRADAGEARAVVGRLEGVVSGLREQIQQVVGDAAGAREAATAAGEAAAAARQLAGQAPETAREAAAATVQPLRAALDDALEELRAKPAGNPEAEAEIEVLRADLAGLRAALENAEGGDAAAVQTLASRLDAVEQTVPDGLDARLDSLREGLSNALGKLEAVSADLAAARTETGAGRHALEQRLADGAAELMAARTDAEQARKGVEGLRDELTNLREYAAAAKTEAAAAREAAANANRVGTSDDRELHGIRTELQVALAKMAEFKTGYEEARQAAVAARREAEQARVAAEKAGAVNEVTTEKFTEVWQKMLSTGPAPAPRSGGSGVRTLGKTMSKPKDAPPARAPQAGFDDDPRPLARLDLKGKFRQLNPGFSKLVGYQEHEFGKATWPSVLDRQVYRDQVTQLEALAAGASERVPVESTFMHGQGLMVLIRGEITLVRDAAGQPDHLLLVAEPGAHAPD